MLPIEGHDFTIEENRRYAQLLNGACHGSISGRAIVAIAREKRDAIAFFVGQDSVAVVLLFVNPARCMEGLANERGQHRRDAEWNAIPFERLVSRHCGGANVSRTKSSRRSFRADSLPGCGSCRALCTRGRLRLRQSSRIARGGLLHISAGGLRDLREEATRQSGARLFERDILRGSIPIAVFDQQPRTAFASKSTRAHEYPGDLQFG